MTYSKMAEGCGNAICGEATDYDGFTITCLKQSIRALCKKGEDQDENEDYIMEIGMDLNENQEFQERCQQRSSQAWNSTCLALGCFSLASSLVSSALQSIKVR